MNTIPMKPRIGPTLREISVNLVKGRVKEWFGDGMESTYTHQYEKFVPISQEEIP